jgi:RNA polymerase sigma-70 factor (ECF subfamily)
MTPDTPVEQHPRHAERDVSRGLGGVAAILAGYDDDALMARAQDGDKEAFEALVSRHMERAAAIATRFLADRARGLAAAQEAFLQLWTARGQYRRGGSFAWFLTTLVLDRCRAARAAESRGHGACRPAAGDDASARMQAALTRLSPGDREVLVMRFGMDLAYQDIANETGRPPSALRSQVFDSLCRLRGLLEGAS